MARQKAAADQARRVCRKISVHEQVRASERVWIRAPCPKQAVKSRPSTANKLRNPDRHERENVLNHKRPADPTTFRKQNNSPGRRAVSQKKLSQRIFLLYAASVTCAQLANLPTTHCRTHDIVALMVDVSKRSWSAHV